MTAHARTTDPATSHEAAASLRDLRESQEHVLRVIRACGPLTDQALVAWYERGTRLGRVPRQSSSGLRTRRAELVARGLVRDTGERERLRSGRMAIKWEASR